MISTKTFRQLLCLGLLGALLQGCGAERDTPFNPSTTSSSSSSSLGNSIDSPTNILLEQQNQTERTEPSPLLQSTSKQLIAIRTPDEMNYYWDLYINDFDWSTDVVDFTEGQVFLWDGGEQGNCDPLLDFASIKAYDHSPNSVKLVIKYTDVGKPSSSSSSSSSSGSSYSEPNCTIDTQNPNHPFRFYYVHSRKVLVFQEEIQ